MASPMSGGSKAMRCTWRIDKAGRVLAARHFPAQIDERHGIALQKGDPAGMRDAAAPEPPVVLVRLCSNGDDLAALLQDCR